MHESAYRDAERRLWSSIGLAPVERIVTLPSTGTEVRALTIGDGPPVLLVHGASNAAASWSGLVARLDGLRLVMVDRPGCGLSEPVPPYRDASDLNAFADRFVGDVLGALGIGRASVVATSFGGLFALRAAAATPDVIDRVALLGWIVGAPTDGIPVSMRVTNLPAVGRLLAAVPPSRRMVVAVLRQIGLGPAIDDGRFGPLEVDTYLALLRDTPTMRNEIRTGRRTMTFRHGFDPAIALDATVTGRIRSPLLFLWGTRDVMGGEQIARPFVASIPGARLELLPDAGHAPWIDDPDGVAHRLAGFLGGTAHRRA